VEEVEKAADGEEETANDPNKVARIQGALAMVAAEVGQGPGVVQSMIDVKATYGHAQEKGIDLVECMKQAFLEGWEEFTDC
jgi:hypothetical protein